VLVESAPFLGGAATLKNVLTYCGLFTNYQKKQAVFGVADQVLRCLRAMGAVSEPIQFHGVAVLIEPESEKYVLDQLCKQAGVQVCLHTMLVSATRNGNHITSVTLHDHQGTHEVSAQAFVDASGEGDLAFFSGVWVGSRQTPIFRLPLGQPPFSRRNSAGSNRLSPSPGYASAFPLQTT
jgi:hypothetical protein